MTDIYTVNQIVARGFSEHLRSLVNCKLVQSISHQFSYVENVVVYVSLSLSYFSLFSAPIVLNSFSYALLRITDESVKY